MAATGLVVINIIGDAQKLKAALAESAVGLEGFSNKMQAVGKAMVGIGTKMTVGLTLPLALLGKASFDAASDLNESLSKVDVVFEDSAGTIRRWSEDAATSFGMSRQAALEAAGTFGNLFRALGISIPVATDMSTKLVQLAADLASFNNANPEEVLLALRAGLVGEAEPLRKFGVSLSQARIEAKALELGLWDGVGAIDASAKAQAAYAIIIEDTALAQGDFARTAEGAANKQRTLTAQFQDSAAKIGQALLPLFVQLAEVVGRLADWFSRLPEPVQKFLVYAGLLLAVIGPLVAVCGALASAVGAVATVLAAVSLPVVAVVAAIGALVAAAVLLYLKWDEVWNAVAKHPALLLILAPLGAILLPIIALVGAIKLVKENWDVIWPAIQAVIEAVAAVINPLLGAIGGLVNAIAGAVVWLKDRAVESWPVVQAVIEAAWAAVQVPLGFMRGLIQGIADAAGAVGGAALLGFGGLSAAAETLWGAINGPLNALAAVLDRILAAARSVKNALDKLPDIPNGGDIGPGDIITAPAREFIDRFRAAGGPVSAGLSYVVGERGPELFTPGSSGHITPNHALGGGNNYSISVNVAPGGSPAETGRAIVEAIRAYEDRSGATWRAA